MADDKKNDARELVARVSEKYLSGTTGAAKSKPKKEKVKSKLRLKAGEAIGGLATKLKDYTIGVMGRHKLATGITALAIAGSLVGGYYLGKDWLTKRHDYPIRQVLYQAQETIYLTGGEELQGSKGTDRESVSTLQKGNENGTKLGDLIGKFTIETSDELVHYEAQDQNMKRVAYSNDKHERIQSGLSITGTINFSEKYAELIGQPGRFITYSFIPENGTKNLQLNVLMDEKGKRQLVNELVTYRPWPYGWFVGEHTVREGTQLNEFVDNEKNLQITNNILKLIDKFDTTINLSISQREKILGEILSLEEKLQTQSVYTNLEDGIIDWLPQESTAYLFSDPGLFKRIGTTMHVIKNNAGSRGKPQYPTEEMIHNMASYAISNPKNDIVRLRIENNWDLWPGNYWLLNKIAIGSSHPNILRPFAHYNNGGYTIKDSKGVVAKIEIIDFLMHYGDDVLYKYYLDKNGDGKINKKTELIGQVLDRISQDEKAEFEPVIGLGKEKRDVTKRLIYSFMAGSDWNRRFEDFYLCNAIESFMVNELYRGFSKHSFLGEINNQRSNILLLETRTLQNLGRAVSPESSLVVKNDMVTMLKAAGRDYVNKYAVSPNNATTSTLNIK